MYSGFTEYVLLKVYGFLNERKGFFILVKSVLKVVKRTIIMRVGSRDFSKERRSFYKEL